MPLEGAMSLILLLRMLRQQSIAARRNQAAQWNQMALIDQYRPAKTSTTVAQAGDGVVGLSLYDHRFPVSPPASQFLFLMRVFDAPCQTVCSRHPDVVHESIPHARLSIPRVWTSAEQKSCTRYYCIPFRTLGIAQHHQNRARAGRRRGI